MRAISTYSATLLTILSLLSFWASGQVDRTQLEKSWVAIESRGISEYSYSPVDGMLLHFTSSDVTLGRIGGDTTISFAYRLDNSLVMIEDTSEMFRILHLSEDSLTVQIGEDMEVLFLPLIASASPVDIDKLEANLLGRSWYRKEGKWKDRFHFFEPTMQKKKAAPSFCLRLQKVRYGYDGAIERWSLSEFHGAILLSLTFSQIDLNVYQVQKIQREKIKVTHLAQYGKIKTVFELNKPLSEAKMNRLKNVLASKPWVAEHIDYLDKLSIPYEKDGVEYDTTRSGGSGLIADTLLLRTDFLYKKLTYSFSNDLTFSISVENEIAMHGHWSITSDGQFIIIGNPKNPQAYLEIINAKSNKLTIGQSIYLRLSPEKLHFVKYDCRIKMK